MSIDNDVLNYWGARHQLWYHVRYMWTHRLTIQNNPYGKRGYYDIHKDVYDCVTHMWDTITRVLPLSLRSLLEKLHGVRVGVPHPRCLIHPYVMVFLSKDFYMLFG